MFYNDVFTMTIMMMSQIMMFLQCFYNDDGGGDTNDDDGGDTNDGEQSGVSGVCCTSRDRPTMIDYNQHATLITP